MDLTLLNYGTSLAIHGIYLLISIVGFIGAVLAAGTREDAFEVAGRQNKWIWVALLGASGFVLFLGGVGWDIPFLSWAAMVFIGLYWWDVRPQINGILRGAGGW